MVWDRHTNVCAQVCVRMCVSTAVRQMGESLTTLIPQLFLLLFQLSHTVCKTTFNFCFCNFSVLTPSATRRYRTTPKHSTPHNTTAPTHTHTLPYQKYKSNFKQHHFCVVVVVLLVVSWSVCCPHCVCAIYMLRAPLYLCVRVFPESSVCAHSSRQKYIDKNSTKFTVFWQSIFRYLSNLIANQAEVEIIEEEREGKLQVATV